MGKTRNNFDATNKTVIGVDPGVSGGIAIRHFGNLRACKMPTEPEIVSLLSPLVDDDTTQDNIVAYVEMVGGYIGEEQPGAHMFNFGDNYGFVRGVLAGLNIPTRLIRPQVWQSAYNLPRGRDDYSKRKRALVFLARQFYGDLCTNASCADALLIMRHGQGVEAGAIKAPVAITSGWDKDAKEAVAWAKAGRYKVPKRNSTEFRELVNYYCREVKNKNPQPFKAGGHVDCKMRCAD